MAWFFFVVVFQISYISYWQFYSIASQFIPMPNSTFNFLQGGSACFSTAALGLLLGCIDTNGFLSKKWNLHGTSIPPCRKSVEWCLCPVIVQIISPMLLKKRLQAAKIFHGTWPEDDDVDPVPSHCINGYGIWIHWIAWLTLTQQTFASSWHPNLYIYGGHLCNF